jgi:hypothetical protein
MTTYDTHRNRQSLARYYFRRAEHFAGRRFPDGRNDELKDLGAVLEWRVRVLRNEQRRAQERLAKRTVHDIGRTIGRVK